MMSDSVGGDQDAHVPPGTLQAWYVIHGFVDEAKLCICGTVDHALAVIFETLERYPDEGPWNRPPTQDGMAVFAAYVLDSWDLLSHAGSIDAGTFRTEKGEALYRAMRRLAQAGEPFLPDPWRGTLSGAWTPSDPPAGLDGLWWRRGASGSGGDAE